MDVVKQIETPDPLLPLDTRTSYGILPQGATKPLLDKDEITTYLEQQAQQLRNKEVVRLAHKLKHRIIDSEATHAYTKSKNLYKSWVRHLWAQRTGKINFQGAKELTDNYTSCPLCTKALSLGVTWHALLMYTP